MTESGGTSATLLALEAAALQRLTLAMVTEAGVNPDLIRREEAPYREAAALVEDEPHW